MSSRCTILWAAVLAALVSPAFAVAHAQQNLPEAPAPMQMAAVGQTPSAPAAPVATQTAAPAAMGNSQSAAPNVNVPVFNGPKLTISQAEQMAIQNNPNISVARLVALAEGQVEREARSADLPTATADLEAVDAHPQSRLTGEGTLNSPRILPKAAAGMTISQLITDFGRTHNLVKSAQSNARAEAENSRATQLDIRLAVDQAFYQALTSQAVLKVAMRTQAERRATEQQVGALEKSNVKSQLDLSFADVQASQADLMVLDAQNNETASMAELNALLGSEQDQQYKLVDETDGNPPPAPQHPEAMIQTAFQQRPDLAALNDRYQAARQYATAQRDLWFPTVSALASGGVTPVRDNLIQSNWYLGAGGNISIPVFNGFLYSAESKEAHYRASAAQEQVRNLRDMIARDVRTSVLNAQTAYQRIAVTQGMLNQANLALDLAQARYKIGLSSIVELTQAQLAQTQAQIEYTTARYRYQTALSQVNYEIGQ